MTPVQVNRLIAANILDWKKVRATLTYGDQWIDANGEVVAIETDSASSFPNFMESLDALHEYVLPEIEKDFDHWHALVDELMAVCDKEKNWLGAYLRLTPTQICSAILKVYGLSQEQKGEQE
jgi:hypothetical protein